MCQVKVSLELRFSVRDVSAMRTLTRHEVATRVTNIGCVRSWVFTK
jgi:hypothetical protein